MFKQMKRHKSLLLIILIVLGLFLSCEEKGTNNSAEPVSDNQIQVNDQVSSEEPASSNKLTLVHSIDIPDKFDTGKSWVHGISPALRYAKAYEKGWWACVKKHNKDIYHNPDRTDIMYSGHGESVGGFAEGYTDCNSRIDQIIKVKGIKYAKKLIRKSLEGY